MAASIELGTFSSEVYALTPGATRIELTLKLLWLVVSEEIVRHL